VDGSLLARVFFTMQLVGCGHVFGKRLFDTTALTACIVG
jgi:hypothetical protein